MFVHVARCGSFAEAARSLNIPPATISRRVQQLEIDLGTRLMQRSTRQLSLTSAGESLREKCAAAIDELMIAGRLHKADGAQLGGTVRVAAPDSFFSFFLMDWVKQFLREFPGVNFDFVLSDETVDMISERIDVAFRSGPIDNTSFVSRRIFKDFGGLAASPDYLATYGTPDSIEDLAEHRCLTFSDRRINSIWRLQDEEGNEKEVRVQGKFSCNTHEGLRRAAIAGLGIAVLPSVLTGHDIASGALIRVLPGYRYGGRGLSVVFPSNQQRPLAVTRFADMAV